MRIAIVNDLALARAVLRRLVLAAPGCTIAWEAADGAEAVLRAQRDRPDVILMDIAMPQLNGIEAFRRMVCQLDHGLPIQYEAHRQELKAVTNRPRSRARPPCRDSLTASLPCRRCPHR